MARTKTNPVRIDTSGIRQGGKTIPGTTPGRAPRKTVKKTVVKRKAKPGMRALRDIRRYQRSTELLIRKAPFYRVVRDVLRDPEVVGNALYRIQQGALVALQEATEAHLVHIFELSNLATIHGKRVTLQVRDMQLVSKMTNISWSPASHGHIDVETDKDALSIKHRSMPIGHQKRVYKDEISKRWGDRLRPLQKSVRDD